MSRKIWVFSGLGLGLALLALRLALPRWIENKVAQGMGESGSISGVGVSLWRLAYQYQDLEFTTKNPVVKAPTFSCPEVDYIHKPFSPKILRAKIKVLLELHGNCSVPG